MKSAAQLRTAVGALIFDMHSAAELGGPHVVAQARDYEELMTVNFLESLDA